jgi:hypothetical protein
LGGTHEYRVIAWSEGVRLLRNDIPQGNWAEFRLHSRVPPAGAALGFGDGATVIAWVGGVPLRRTVSISSYLSQDSHRVHFGLGPAAKIDRLEVQLGVPRRAHLRSGRNLVLTIRRRCSRSCSSSSRMAAHPARITPSSCPCSRRARPRKCAPQRASMSTYRLAVKCNRPVRKLLAYHNFNY